MPFVATNEAIQRDAQEWHDARASVTIRVPSGNFVSVV